MLLERKQDLAVYYWLKEQFASTPFVNIVDGFPVEGLTIPTVSVDTVSIDTEKFQMGSSMRIKHRIYVLDIFAANKSQRDEFAYKLLNALEERIPVYDYDEGFPPDISPTKIGALTPDELHLDIVRVYPELVTKLFYRAAVSFVAVYEQS
jgi:hypothetical protein